MAQREDIVIDQGSRNVIVISVTVAWLSSLAGYDARGAVYQSQTIPGVQLADLSSYLTVDAPSSTVTLDIPANVTGAWDWDRGHYDMELFDANPAHDVRFVQGEIRLDKEVTT